MGALLPLPSLSACFLVSCLREGTSPIYGQHGHHSFDSSLPSSSNHIGQAPIQQLWHPGQRRCDNYYNGEVMPCLMRPWLPPFSYSTTEGNNGEYKRKRRSARTWRAV